jgi:protein arginine kinase
MIIDELIKKRAKWLEGTGPFSPSAMSTRIRLARNIEKMPFPHRATKENLKEIIEIVEEAVKKHPLLKKTAFLKLDKLSDIDKQFLVERHLISIEHAEHGEKAVIIDENEQISIMINEEDHIRIQVMNSGLQFNTTYELADKIDNEFSKLVQYAFSSSYGYLTCCPTNTGTGLRASVMVHLPALVFSGKIDKVLQGISKLGLTVRGLYGEGTEVRTAFFQISNQTTLGKEENEIIDEVERIAKQVIESEEQTKKVLLQNIREKIEDKIYRAYAILKNARIISSKEVFESISAVQLGVEIGIIKNVSIGTLNEILIFSQPAHIQKMLGMEMEPYVRDIKRAEFIREKLKNSSL